MSNTVGCPWPVDGRFFFVAVGDLNEEDAERLLAMAALLVDDDVAMRFGEVGYDSSSLSLHDERMVNDGVEEIVVDRFALLLMDDAAAVDDDETELFTIECAVPLEFITDMALSDDDEDDDEDERMSEMELDRSCGRTNAFEVCLLYASLRLTVVC